MGVCYENGEGVRKSRPKALMWYKEAAQNGNQKAIAAVKELEGK